MMWVHNWEGAWADPKEVSIGCSSFSNVISPSRKQWTKMSWCRWSIMVRHSDDVTRAPALANEGFHSLEESVQKLSHIAKGNTIQNQLVLIRIKIRLGSLLYCSLDPMTCRLDNYNSTISSLEYKIWVEGGSLTLHHICPENAHSCARTTTPTSVKATEYIYYIRVSSVTIAETSAATHLQYVFSASNLT